MSDYHCLFCRELVTPENVLFTEKVKGGRYTDEKRWERLNKCGFYANTKTDDAAEAVNKQFPDLYYRATKDNVKARDANGFPQSISARPGDALTPRELIQAEKNDPPEAYAPGDEDGYVSPAETAGEQAHESAKPAGTAYARIAQRACPHCHSWLPEDFGILPHYTITLIGGRAAGKTAYLACLIQQLNLQLPAHQLGTVELLSDSEKFFAPKLRYYETNGTTEPTPVAFAIYPLVFKYTNGYVRPKRACYLSINDIAGEGVGNVNYLINHDGLRESEILLMIIDPNQLNHGGYYDAEQARRTGLAPDAGEPFFPPEKECFQNDVAVFLADSGDKCRTIAQNVKHVVVIITKFDMLLTAESATFTRADTPLVHDIGDSTHQGCLDLAVAKRVNNDLTRYLDDKMHMKPNAHGLANLIRQAFENFDLTVNLTCASTYTLKNNRADDAGVPGGFKFENDYTPMGSKHRIIEPFLEVLAQCGMIDVCNKPEANKNRAVRRKRGRK